MRALHAVEKTRRVVHTCSCGAEYTREAWSALPLVGIFVDDTDPDATDETGVAGRCTLLEQRNCKCGSTRALPLGLDGAIALLNDTAVRLRRALGALHDIRRAAASIPDTIEACTKQTLRGTDDVLLERERCATIALRFADNLRLVAQAKPGKAMARELGNRADLCREIATEIRGR